VWHFIRNYVVSLAAVLALGFLLLVSLLVTAGLAVFGNMPHRMCGVLLHLITILASVGVISLLCVMMFKWLPDAAVDWYDVWLGAVVTAVFLNSGNPPLDFTSANKDWSLRMGPQH
jgi:membrane protein